ncbi:MAG: pilus assembly protein [Betaproteobacteria bacterium]|nr:MAG: pilus assembly protein [Betaproteobacteria bacterium]
MTTMRQRARFGQSGVTAVEFALISVALVLLLVGIVQFGLAMFIFDSAAEATRRGARLAVVSPVGSYARIETEMRYVMPLSEGCTMSIAWMPNSPQQCDARSCEYVVASVQGCTVWPWFAWFIDPLAVPAFATALPRESLGVD